MALTLGKSVSSANHIQRALSSTSQRSPSSTHKTLMCAVVQRRLPLLSLSLALPSSLTHTARLAWSYNNSTERARERERGGDSDREREAKQRSPPHGLDTATSSIGATCESGVLLPTALRFSQFSERCTCITAASLRSLHA